MFNTQNDGFLNTRTRIQRLEDARFYSGWVLGFLGTHLSLRLPNSESISAEDRFFVTLNSATCSATFHAKVLAHGGEEVSMTLETTPKFASPSEDVRYATEALGGAVFVGSRRIELQIEDISMKGLGGRCEVELPRGSQLRFEIDGLYGPVGGVAEVRYCRPDAESGRFRVGLLIVQVGRIDQARWSRMLGTSLP